MHDDYLTKLEISKINVESIVEVITNKYRDNFSKIDHLLSDYMADNGLTPESTITCQDCITLMAKVNGATHKIMSDCLTEILSQIWFELSQGDQDE